LTLDATTDRQRLSLCTLDQVPSQPLIWRIAFVRNKPNRVTVESGAVGVNTGWGEPLPERNNERKTARKPNGWYYDAAAQRLIVKVSTLGTACPAP
jgi:hypothetical protein